MSRSAAPSSTGSPSCTRHFVTMPVFIAMPSFGMATSVIIGVCVAQRVARTAATIRSTDGM